MYVRGSSVRKDTGVHDQLWNAVTAEYILLGSNFLNDRIQIVGEQLFFQVVFVMDEVEFKQMTYQRLAFF